MDYEKLLDPYKENDRTVVGQVSWLLKKGIPKATIDQAMLYVYDALDRGEKYASGHELDRALFDKAMELLKADVAVSLKQLQDFHQKMRDEWGADLSKLALAKKTAWKKIVTFLKMVFTLGIGR